MECIHCKKTFDTTPKHTKHVKTAKTCALKEEILKLKEENKLLKDKILVEAELNHQLDIERVKTNIYKQIIEQSMCIKIIDRQEEINIYSDRISINIYNSTTNVESVQPTKIIQLTEPPKVLSSSRNVLSPAIEKVPPRSNTEGSVRSYIVEDDAMSINPYNSETIKDKVLSYFDLNKDSLNIIEKCFDSIKTKKTYNESIVTIKKERNNLMARMDIDKYILLVNEHIQKLTDIFKEKNQIEVTKNSTAPINDAISARQSKSTVLYSDVKIKKIIASSLTSLEQRLIGYDKYYTIDFEFDDIDRFQIASIYRTKNNTKVFDIDSILKCIINYGLALYPISKNIDKILFNSPELNLIYLQLNKHESSRDAFSFYKLSDGNRESSKEETAYMRYWVLDCRLEATTFQIRTAIINHTRTLFRKIYYDIFHDNNYRIDYKTHLGSIESEMDQLVQNFVASSDHIMFNDFLKKIVIKYATYTPNLFDNFNLKSDDTLQKRITDEDNQNEMVESIQKLFDDISEEHAKKFLSKNIVDLLSHKF